MSPQSNIKKAKEDMCLGLQLLIDALPEDDFQELSKEALMKKVPEHIGLYLERIQSAFTLLGQDPSTSVFLKRLNITADTFAKEKWEPSEVIFQDRLGIDDDEMIYFYECGRNFFEREEYTKAGDIFNLLVLLNPFIPSYWRALGFSEEKREEYTTAVLAYSMDMAHSKDFMPSYFIARCLSKVGKAHDAIALLDHAIEEAKKGEGNEAFISLAQEYKQKL